MNIYIHGIAKPAKRGRMQICFVAINQKCAEIYVKQLGKGSNLAAEWHALFHAVGYATEHNSDLVVMLSKSESLVRAVNGISRIRSAQVHSLKAQYSELIVDLPMIKTVYSPAKVNFASRFMSDGVCQELERDLFTYERVIEVVVRRKNV